MNIHENTVFVVSLKNAFVPSCEIEWKLHLRNFRRCGRSWKITCKPWRNWVSETTRWGPKLATADVFVFFCQKYQQMVHVVSYFHLLSKNVHLNKFAIPFFQILFRCHSWCGGRWEISSDDFCTSWSPWPWVWSQTSCRLANHSALGSFGPWIGRVPHTW